MRIFCSHVLAHETVSNLLINSLSFGWRRGQCSRFFKFTLSTVVSDVSHHEKKKATRKFCTMCWRWWLCSSNKNTFLCSSIVSSLLYWFFLLIFFFIYFIRRWVRCLRRDSCWEIFFSSVCSREDQLDYSFYFSFLSINFNGAAEDSYTSTWQRVFTFNVSALTLYLYLFMNFTESRFCFSRFSSGARAEIGFGSNFTKHSEISSYNASKK